MEKHSKTHDPAIWGLLIGAMILAFAAFLGVLTSSCISTLDRDAIQDSSDFATTDDFDMGFEPLTPAGGNLPWWWYAMGCQWDRPCDFRNFGSGPLSDPIMENAR